MEQNLTTKSVENSQEQLTPQPVEAQLSAPASPAQQLEIPSNYVANLAPREQQQIQVMAKSIDITDKQMVQAFGAEQEATLSKFADTMLKGSGSAAIGEAGVLLDDVMTNLRGYEETCEGKKGILGLFKRSKNYIETIKDKYTKVDTKIGTIVQALTTKDQEIKRISREFDGMFEENKKAYLYLTDVIAAGEIAEQDAKQKLSVMQTEVNVDPQDIRDFSEAINRFDRRLYNLKLCRALAISTAPQIRNVQNSADRVSESIHQAITISIPAWKTQMAIALGMRTVRTGLDIVNSVNETTDALILAVSNEGKALSIESAKAQERGVINIETLRTVNNNLIEAITESSRIAREAVEERARNSEELKTLETSLQTALKTV